MASGWMGGKASEPSNMERITHRVEVNLHQIRLTVPAGGRAPLPTDPGPLIVPRTKEGHLKSRSIFSREYGKSKSLGKDFGAFQISLNVVSLPQTFAQDVPVSIDLLAGLIASTEKNPDPVGVVSLGEVEWVFEDIRGGMLGHTYLYTRRLDDDALVMLKFALDRDRMQSDPIWLEARRRDIAEVLRSVVIE